MTKRYRTILFFIIVILFLVCSTLLVLYSLGYKIDWKTRTITQTGALYIKATPPSATISINGQPAKKTSIFVGSALISDLLPGNYRIRIEKEGYLSWEKTLEIKPNEATEAKNIFLFPNETAFRTINNSAKNIWLAPNGISALLLEENDGIKRIIRWDTRTDAKTLLLRLELPEQNIVRIQWSGDSTRVLVQLIQDSLEKAFVASVLPQEKLWCQEIICRVDISNDDEKTVQFSPVSRDRFIALQKLSPARTVTEMDYTTREHFSFWGTDVLAFFTEQNKLYWLERDGSVWVKELALASPPKHAARISFTIQAEKTYEIFSFKDQIFVKEGANLFTYNQRPENFSKIADNVVLLAPAPDYERLLILSGAELWVYYLTDQLESPRKKKGDFVFLNRFNDALRSPVWIMNNYVAFITGDALKIAEIDDRSNVNIYTLLTAPQSKTLWLNETKTFLIATPTGLLASERIIR